MGSADKVKKALSPIGGKGGVSRRKMRRFVGKREVFGKVLCFAQGRAGNMRNRRQIDGGIRAKKHRPGWKARAVLL